METKGRIAVYVLFTVLAATALAVAGSQTAGSWPGAGEGYEGWTAEAELGPDNPRHVQLAHGGGYLYRAADNASNVYFNRASDEDSLDWDYIGYLDVDPNRRARDSYLAANSSYVVESHKEMVGSRWALVIRLSTDQGASWPGGSFVYMDSSAEWDNYEAHVVLRGDKVHAAYVSNYEGRNEVYYLRLTCGASGLSVHKAPTCVTDNGDGTAATQPCILAESASRYNIYYVHGSSSPHPVYESYTVNSGDSWAAVTDIIPVGSGADMSWPECDYWWDGGDFRKMVVCDGDVGTNRHVYSRRYITGEWQGSGSYAGLALADCDDDMCTYPQISKKGTDLLVVYRHSGGSIGNEGSGRYNDNTGENGSWHTIDNLFHNTMPYANPGSIDCCSDGSRFYAACAGTGTEPKNKVLTKREDNQDPTASIDDPGRYLKENTTISVTARDDFDRTNGWFLTPSSDKTYARGIVYVEFHYKKAGSGVRTDVRRNDTPYSFNFPAASLPEGGYQVWADVEDTAGHADSADAAVVTVDRTPPGEVKLQVSPPDGDNGWYRSQPGVGPAVTASDPVSGVKASYYRFDGEADWTLYSRPFELREGCHDIHYYAEDRAGNASSPATFSYRADFTDPEGEIVSPPPGRYFRNRMEAEASCRDGGSGVEKVTWLVDGNPMASSSNDAATLDISGIVDGQHSLRAEVKDAAGRTCLSEPVLFYKDVTPPTVEVVEPTGEHWVRGMITVKADIKDNLEVGRAEFLVDGEVIDERTSAPWMAAWDTSTVKNGYHVVRVKAWDAAGNSAEVTASGETTLYVGNNISETNHFAEGCTREGFDTWLCLQNPGEEQADVTVNYYLGEGQGSASARTYSLPPHSRSTIYVNGDVGAEKDVSIQVTSNKPIVSERPMYFDYGGTEDHGWQGCHTAQGAHFPREDWYFAEGCTRDGFETWLCLQNPEGKEAIVEVEYMMENGAAVNRSYRVAPWSRGTVLVNREVGEGHDVSMRVVANAPVVAERPVYFLYQGMWDGGHNVMGAARPETEWYFAEGCTRTGFNQWICLMNPNDEAASSRIVYVMEDGGRIEREYVLEPRSRFTINVNDDVARQHDVSALISSEKPLVVERPMYFLYNSVIDEGSNAMGVCTPGSSWYLAEGCTREGFEEWICLMNPGEEEAEVILRFMLEDSSVREHVVSVPPATRVTVKVNDVVGPDHDVSAEVMSDSPVVVERPMYSIYRGSCPSGDTLSGYTFNP